jgi:tetratricopeptide (TPR) repeat protein
MCPKLHHRLWILLSTIFLIMEMAPASAQSVKRARAAQKPTPTEALRMAQTAFQKEDFSRSLFLYRSYLRRYPKDADVWSQYAVSLYFSGEFDAALRILKRWQKSTRVPAYNSFYQGLIYVSQKNYPEARIQLMDATQKQQGQYSERAIYELIAIDYEANDLKGMLYWSQEYLRRYPQGGFRKNVLLLSEEIKTTPNRLSPIEGNKKPDFKKALFRFHRRSLSPREHYWFLRTGYDYTGGSEAAPASDKPSGIALNPIVEQAAFLHLGLGLGPTQHEDITLSAGYNYRQDWHTDETRLSQFAESFEDVSQFFAQFPYRPDLLERAHELYVDLDADLGSLFFVRLFMMQDFKFIGSSLIATSDQKDIEQKTFRVSDASTIVPEVGIRYLKNHQTKLFLYMKKEINEDAKEYSYKSYNFSGSGDPMMSLGVEHQSLIPEYNDLMLSIRAFQYDYMFNDYWLDYTRTGGLFAARIKAGSQIELGLFAGMYNDTFQLPLLRQSGCKFRKTESSDQSEPVRCPRVNETKTFGAHVLWQIGPMSELRAGLIFADTKNPTLQVYDRNSYNVTIEYVTAFPDTKIPYVRHLNQKMDLKP